MTVTSGPCNVLVGVRSKGEQTSDPGNIYSMDIHTTPLRWRISGILIITAFVSIGCGSEPVQPETAGQAAPVSPGHRIYVTNERSDNLSVIDSATHEVVATIPLGKRPRGIHASPDGKTIYVALSGSPIAGPGVDEDSLPPADKKADGIGVVDVAQ